MVLRGLPLPDGGRFTIGDLALLVVGPAQASQWPDAELVRGDLDAVVWVSPEDAFRAAATLHANERVVAVRFDVSS